MLFFAACSDDVDIPKAELQPNTPGTLTVNLQNCAPSRSDDDELGYETKIESLHIGLYHKLAEENTEAVEWVEIKNTDGVWSATAASGAECTVVDNSKVVWKLEDNIVMELFDGGVENTTCRIVALANVENVPPKASIDAMRSLAIGPHFSDFLTPQSLVMEGESEVNYSKDNDLASSTVKLVRAAAKINLTINLPGKVEIEDKGETWESVPGGIKVLLNNGVSNAIARPIGADNSPWKPEDTNYYFSSSASDESTYRTMQEATATGGTLKKYTLSSPYYTYPNTWIENLEGNHKTSLTLMVPWKRVDEGASADAEPMVYYYQVAATPTNVNYISRNNCYNVSLTVGMLGSVMPEKPLEVTGSYQIVDWQQEEIGVPIQDTRYLVVSPTEYTLNNEEEIAIPFYTSHATEISDITISYKRFNFFNDGKGDVVDITIPKKVIDRSYKTTDDADTAPLCSCSIGYSEATKQLTLKIRHQLKIWIPYQRNGTTEVMLTGVAPGSNKEATLKAVNNSIYVYKKPASPEASYSPYEITVTLQHTDMPEYNQSIIITQYPGMYIEAVRNPGGYYNNGYDRNYNPTSRNYGNVFVNAVYYWVDKKADGTPLDNPFGYWANNNVMGSGVTSLGAIVGMASSNTNTNPNNYIITISQLESDSQFIIGDARSEHINNDLDKESGGILDCKSDQKTDAGTWCFLANALYEGKDNDGNLSMRKLRYYYPSKEYAPSEKEAYIVSPKFRIASSFGVCSRISKVNARRRAATYQERGCPAGRWRLPTLGEMKFIMRLSQKGYIPALFNHTAFYWSSSVPVKPNGLSEGNINGNAFVRSVYDDWYWNEKTDYVLNPDETGAYSYTLGDMPRVPRE